MLRDRYQNNRMILRAHVHAISTQKQLTNETAKDLRQLVETVEEHRLALENMGQPVDQQDIILVCFVTEKLPADMRKFWELSTPGTDPQTYNDLKKVLEARCLALEASTLSAPTISSQHRFTTRQNNNQQSHSSQRNYNNNATTNKINCECCNGTHKIHLCPKFMQLSVPNRAEFVKMKKLCFNCLRAGHRQQECKGSTCKNCNLQHHTLLHLQSPRQTRSVNSTFADNNRHNESEKTTNTESPPPEQFTATSLSHQTTGTVFLQTAMIPTLVNGETTLPYQPEKSSSYSSESFCNVMSKLTNIFLHARFPLRLSSIFQILSSPIRHSTHLLESTCSLELNFMKPSRIKENNNITYCDSLFGWVVIGGSPSVSIQTLTTCLSSLSSIPEEETLKKCWEIEDLPQGHHFTTPANNIFNKPQHGMKMDYSSSNYLSKKTPYPLVTLFGKQNVASKHFFTDSPKTRAFILDTQPSSRNFFWIWEPWRKSRSLNIPIATSKSFYLPHLCVLKDSSTTTKLRVVFDASAKTTSGVALNDNLMLGPKIQKDLFEILIRFRFLKVVLSVDIAKMYRQVLLDKEDKNFHRLLWKETQSSTLEYYRITRNTYGVTSAVFHAIQPLFELAETTQHPR